MYQALIDCVFSSSFFHSKNIMFGVKATAWCAFQVWVITGEENSCHQYNVWSQNYKQHNSEV